MSFGTHDQIILTGLEGHRTAHKFNGMRGVIVQTKTYYLKKGMHTVLVLPESGGKAHALTVKAKYLRVYVGGGDGGHADDSSVIIETYGRSSTKLFGVWGKTTYAPDPIEGGRVRYSNGLTTVGGVCPPSVKRYWFRSGNMPGHAKAGDYAMSPKTGFDPEIAYVKIAEFQKLATENGYKDEEGRDWSSASWGWTVDG